MYCVIGMTNSVLFMRTYIRECSIGSKSSQVIFYFSNLINREIKNLKKKWGTESTFFYRSNKKNGICHSKQQTVYITICQSKQ